MINQRVHNTGERRMSGYLVITCAIGVVDTVEHN